MKIDDEYDDPYVVGRITQLENIANTVPMFSGTLCDENSDTRRTDVKTH